MCSGEGPTALPHRPIKGTNAPSNGGLWSNGQFHRHTNRSREWIQGSCEEDTLPTASRRWRRDRVQQGDGDPSDRIANYEDTKGAYRRDSVRSRHYGDSRGDSRNALAATPQSPDRLVEGANHHEPMPVRGRPRGTT